MGLETIALVTASAAALASTGVSIANYEAGKDAAAAQKSLADQQAAHLKSEEAARTAEAAKQATTGATFGFSEDSARSVMTGFGFGAAPSGSANSGRGQITGLG